MADNTTLNTGSGGDTLATDDIAGVKYPRSKIVLGADGSNDGDVSSANPLPVTGTLTAVTSITNTVSVDDNSGSLTVDNAGTFAVQVDGDALTALQLLDDAIYTDATGTPSKGIAVMGTDGTNPQLISVDASGNVQVDLVTANVTNAGTFAVQAAQSGTWNVGAVTSITNTVTVQGTETPLDGIAASASSLPVLSQSMVWNGAAFDLMREGGTAGSLLVDGSTVTQPVSGTVTANAGTGTFTVDNGGTFAVQAAQSGTWNVATVTTVTTCSTVTAITGSSVAHDSADSGNPHKIGAKATTSLAGLTLVADADRTDLRAGTDGALIVRNGYSLEDIVSEVDTNTDGASTAFASGLAAPGAGIRLYITRVTIANSSSSFCTVDLRDGAAGSVLWTVPVPAEGGVTQTFDPPLKLTANTALAYDASAATTTLTISGLGFKSKV